MRLLLSVSSNLRPSARRRLPQGEVPLGCFYPKKHAWFLVFVIRMLRGKKSWRTLNRMPQKESSHRRVPLHLFDRPYTKELESLFEHLFHAANKQSTGKGERAIFGDNSMGIIVGVELGCKFEEVA